MPTKQITNKLSILQQEESGFNFIKSYPILNKICKSPLEKSILELILSYQDKNCEFYMNNSEISKIFNCKLQSVKNAIHSLKKKEWILSTNTSNYNGTGGGSSSTHFVNLALIISLLKNDSNVDIVSAHQEEILQPEPTVEINDSPTTDELLTILNANAKGLSPEQITTLESFVQGGYIPTLKKLYSEIESFRMDNKGVTV